MKLVIYTPTGKLNNIKRPGSSLKRTEVDDCRILLMKEQLMIQTIPHYMSKWWWCAMAWAHMATNGTGSLVFFNGVTTDRSRAMNSVVYWGILYTHIQPNSTNALQKNHELMHTAKKN